MSGWRGHLEVPLDVGLSRGTAIDPRVGIDEGEVLALLDREARRRDPIDKGSGLRFLSFMNVHYRVKLTDDERAELKALENDGRTLLDRYP
jgi:hypothetical protein